MAIDTIEVEFSADDQPAEDAENTTVRNTRQQEDTVTACADWFEKDKAAKNYYATEMDELDKLYNSSHWTMVGPTGAILRTTAQQRKHPNTVENLAMSLIESMVSEFSQDVELVDFPVEPGDDEAARTMTDLKEFITYKNRLVLERQKWFRDLFLYGTAIWHIYWDPDWQGGRGPNRWKGDIRWKRLHPRNLFPDARCGSDISQATRVHKAMYVPLEHIRTRYPEYGGLAQADVVDDALSGDLSTLDEQDDSGESREDSALLVETWYVGEPLILGEGEQDQGEGLHVVWWTGDSQRVYLKHANYVYFDPGVTPLYPFVIRQRYPRESTRQTEIWGYGDGHFVKWPQLAYNKTVETILEAHMHNALGMTVYEEGVLSAKQEKQVQESGTLPGWWQSVQPGMIDRWKRVFGNPPPASLQTEANRIQKAMETIVGRFDISQGRTPGSVTAFRALDLLAKQAKVRLQAAEVLVSTAYEDCSTFINHLIPRYYTEQRAYRVFGNDRQGATRHGMFKADQIQKVYVPGTNQVMPRSQFQPEEGMVEGKDYEVYSPEFDVKCRTSTALPSDRMFYMDMAQQLFEKGIIDIKTFLEVIEDGKFPPIEEMVQRVEANQAKLQQAQAAANAPQGPPPVSVGVIPPVGDVSFSLSSKDPNVVLATLQQVMQQAQTQAAAMGAPPDLAAVIAQLPPELQQRIQSLPPEAQAQVLQELSAASGPAAPNTEGMG